MSNTKNKTYILKAGELPPTEIEKQVLEDYLDWGVYAFLDEPVMISKELINQYLSGGSKYADCIKNLNRNTNR